MGNVHCFSIKILGHVPDKADPIIFHNCTFEETIMFFLDLDLCVF